MQEEEQSPGVDPARSNKRNSGLFSFLKWFRYSSASRESVNSSSTDTSISGSTDSIHSSTSIGTVASFSYLPPASYKAPIVLEKCITSGPETDTYKARLKQRDKRRESDKNITLRKKYNLFFSRGDSNKKKKGNTNNPEAVEDTNCKSLPLMTRKKATENDEEDTKGRHRRTNSDSSKNRKSGAYLHVKGKRKAPQPPMIVQVEDSQGRNTLSLLRRNNNKKRLAPAPPPTAPAPDLLTKARNGKNDVNIVYADADDVIFNDSLKLDHGILKPTKLLPSEASPSASNQNINNAASNNNSPNTSARCSYVETITPAVITPVSPRPWYKRNSISSSILTNGFSDKSKKSIQDNKYEPLEKFPYNKKDEKRKSGLSYLANISELDREAAEILSRKEQTKKVEEVPNDMPEFMRPKDAAAAAQEEVNIPTATQLQPRRKSARDLIAKFNAITNVTKVTVNSTFFGSKSDGQKENKRDYFGRAASVNAEETTYNSPAEDINRNKVNPLMKSESACIIKCKSEPKEQVKTPKADRKAAWFCPKCRLENDYWRIICYVCSTIKPYFDDLTTPSNDPAKNTAEIKPASVSFVRCDDVAKNTAVNALERSKTQIGFSALAQYNNNRINKNASASAADGDTKKDEREKLKKMLIDMKNSLPKRRSSGPNLNRKSTIDENPELAVKIDNEIKEVDSKTTTDKVAVVEAPKTAEVIIVTTQTVYENIKVKKLAKNELVKPLKVSTSAQTSAVVRKPLPASLKELLPSAPSQESSSKANYELLRPKDFADIYNSNRNHIYTNTPLEASSKASKDLFIRIPKQEQTSADVGAANTADTLEINRLLRRLETAIARGELTQASVYARDLAHLKVNCSVVRQKSVEHGVDKHDKQKETFTIDMFVEDRLSHRGPFAIQVEADFTVLQLKKLVANDFEIPVEVQRWILGKELAVNDNGTLKDYEVAKGCAVFLYLVAPAANVQNSIGADKENKETKIAKVSEAQPLKVTSLTELKHGPATEQTKPTIVDVKLKEKSAPKSENTGSITTPISSILAKVAPSSSTTKEIVTPHQKQEVKTEPTEVEKPKTASSTIEVQIKRTDTKTKITAVDNKLTLQLKEIKPTLAKAEELSPMSPVKDVIKTVAVKDVAKPVLKQTEWACKVCTLLNPLSSNICGVCANIKHADPVPVKRGQGKGRGKVEVETQKQHYHELVKLDHTDLVPNTEPFECLICLEDVKIGTGVTLRECLHQFCRVCLAHTVEFCEEAEVKCPYRDAQYSCDIALQAREIKTLVSKPIYDQFLARSVKQAENKSQKSFHCKTADCGGWCLYEDNVNQFRCPVCRRMNCLTCQAIHEGLDCLQYQDTIVTAAPADSEDTRRTRAMLDDMVRSGDALHCPACLVVLMKKWGCDWVRCTVCKTEICWVTRGPRWGAGGKGDTTAGCRCGVNGVKCHPQCNYCH